MRKEAGRAQRAPLKPRGRKSREWVSEGNRIEEAFRSETCQTEVGTQAWGKKPAQLEWLTYLPGESHLPVLHLVRVEISKKNSISRKPLFPKRSPTQSPNPNTDHLVSWTVDVNFDAQTRYKSNIIITQRNNSG